MCAAKRPFFRCPAQSGLYRILNRVFAHTGEIGFISDQMIVGFPLPEGFAFWDLQARRLRYVS